jgi:hypothetical protein
MSEPQTKEKELPTSGPAMMRYLRELEPFLAREGSTTTIGPDNSIKHSFKMPMEAKQAMIGARDQVGLSDYKGLDPQDVIALMTQQNKLDQEPMEESMKMSQIRNLAAMSRQYDAQPGLKLADMASRFMENVQRNKTAENVADVKAQGSKLDQLKSMAFLELYNRNPMAALQGMYPGSKPAELSKLEKEVAFLVSKDIPLQEAITMSKNPGLTPAAKAYGLTKADIATGMGGQLKDASKNMEKLQKEFTPPPTPLAPAGEMSSRGYQDAQGTQFKNPEVSEIARSLLGGPNPNIIPAPDRTATLAMGDKAEATRIASEGTLAKSLWRVGADTPLGPVTSIDKSGKWAKITAPNGEVFVVSQRK